MRRIAALALLAAPGSAMAASGPFLSLGNSDFVVLIAFALFVGVLIYLGVPAIVGRMLDQRAEGIADDQKEADAILEEARTLLEQRKAALKEAEKQAGLTVERAREEAADVARQAQADVEASVRRRERAAQEQVASAEAAAAKEVRERAVNVAVDVAREIVAGQISDAQSAKLFDAAIARIGTGGAS